MLSGKAAQRGGKAAEQAAEYILRRVAGVVIAVIRIVDVILCPAGRQRILIAADGIAPLDIITVLGHNVGEAGKIVAGIVQHTAAIVHGAHALRLVVNRHPLCADTAAAGILFTQGGGKHAAVSADGDLHQITGGEKALVFKSGMDLGHDLVPQRGGRVDAAGGNAARFVLGLPLEKMPPEQANAMAKGLPQPGTITCIRCPKGCRVMLGADGKTEGNACPKGEEYALQEAKAPKRVLTTTLKNAAGKLVPVKTSAGVPKETLLRCMDVVRGLPPIPEGLHCGKVAVSDPFGLGIDLVVTGDQS